MWSSTANFWHHVYSMTILNQVSKSMTLIWYARMVAPTTKMRMAQGRQGFSRRRRGVGCSWEEFWWSRGASSSTAILQWSFGCLYPVGWVSEVFWSCNSLSNKILFIQRLTADYTSPTTTHIGCRSWRAFEVKSLQCTFMVPGIRQRSGWFFPDCICGTFDLNISPRKWEKLIF